MTSYSVSEVGLFFQFSAPDFGGIVEQWFRLKSQNTAPPAYILNNKSMDDFLKVGLK